MNNIDKQYTALLQDILDNGVEKKDRTGTGTKSIFCYTISHNMKNGFPLLTTKKMAWKTMVTELLWFLRGETNIKYLVDNNCHIWDGDAFKNYISKTNEFKGDWPDTMEEFINKIKTDDEFAKKWGELGSVYGKQWRDWGGEFSLHIGLESDGSQDKIKLSQEVMQGINNAKKQLKSTPGRLVVIETRHLKSLINNGDPYKRPEVIILDLTTQFFNENKLFKSHLSENSERIIKAYQEDFLHNDVPIFYYNSINKTITYHDITIGSVKTPLEIFRDNLPLPKMTDLEWSQYVGSMRKRHGVDWLNIIKENMGRRVFGMATPAAAQAAVVVSAPAVSHHDDSHNYMYMDTMEEEEMEVG